MREEDTLNLYLSYISNDTTDNLVNAINLILKQTAVELFLKLLKMRNKNKCNILHILSYNNHADCLELIAKKARELGINNVINEMINIKCTNKWWWRYKWYAEHTPLHIAAGRGHESIVDWLLVNGAAIDIKDQFHATPLCLAAFYGHLPVVKKLVIKGADLLPGGVSNPPCPLYVSIERHCLDVAFYFVDLSGYSDTIKRTPVLCHAVSHFPHEGLVQNLYQKGASLEAQSNEMTPLLIAASKEDRQMVDLLIRLGANKNAINRQGKNYQQILNEIEAKRQNKLGTIVVPQVQQTVLAQQAVTRENQVQPQTSAQSQPANSQPPSTNLNMPSPQQPITMQQVLREVDQAQQQSSNLILPPASVPVNTNSNSSQLQQSNARQQAITGENQAHQHETSVQMLRDMVKIQFIACFTECLKERSLRAMQLVQEQPAPETDIWSYGCSFFNQEETTHVSEYLLAKYLNERISFNREEIYTPIRNIANIVADIYIDQLCCLTPNAIELLAICAVHRVLNYVKTFYSSRPYLLSCLSSKYQLGNFRDDVLRGINEGYCPELDNHLLETTPNATLSPISQKLADLDLSCWQPHSIFTQTGISIVDKSGRVTMRYDKSSYLPNQYGYRVLKQNQADLLHLRTENTCTII